MVSVADEEGRLVLMGVDATYCVVDEVDTTTSTLNDHFLHQAIEDAEGQTSIKQEPLAPDSDTGDSRNDPNDTLTPDLSVKDQTESGHTQISTESASPREVKVECLPETSGGEVSQRERGFPVSDTSVLRAVLEREPVSLREPEKMPLPSLNMLGQWSASAPHSVEIVDSATGKIVGGPVLKRKVQRNSRPKTSSPSDSTEEVRGSTPEHEGREGKEWETSENAEGEVAKGKRQREKSYQCGVCQRWFSCKSHVVEHMRTHTGEKPFQCPVCHKRFSQKSNIHQHMNTHTQQRPFRCNDCGKDFMYRGSLYKHKRLHTGERPYTCGICKRRFTHASQLFEHIRTHTNERPFKCGVCQRAFAHSGTMHRHQRNHFSQARSKSTGVVEVGDEGEEVVKDINHNTVPYRSHMDSQRSGDILSEAAQPSPDVKTSESDQLQTALNTDKSHLVIKSVTETEDHSKRDESLPSSMLVRLMAQRGSPSSQAADSSSSSPARTAHSTPLKGTSKTTKETSSRTGSRRKKPTAGKPQVLDGGKADVNSVPSGFTGTSETSVLDGSSPDIFHEDGASSESSLSTASTAITQQREVVSSVTKTAALEVPEKMEVVCSAPSVMTNSHGKTPSKTVTLLLASSFSLSPSSPPAMNTNTASASVTPTPTVKSTGKIPIKRSRATKQPQDGPKKKRTRLETPELKIFSCDICGRGFCHRRSVKRHKLASHPEFVQDGELGSIDTLAESRPEVILEGGTGTVDTAAESATILSQEQQQGKLNHVNTTLLKSLLTLTAEHKNKPLSQSQAPAPGIQLKAVQSLEDQLQVQPVGSQPSGVQVIGVPLFGEASASLQAIAHLCVQDQSAVDNINRISKIVLEKSQKDSLTCSVNNQVLPQSGKPCQKNIAADVNQNIPKTMPALGEQEVTTKLNQSMPKISLKSSRTGPTGCDVNQNPSPDSDTCSLDSPTGTEADEGDMGSRSNPSDSSAQDSLWATGTDTCESMASVVVKLEPVDDAD